jgi:hypothetical protein
VSVAVDPPTGTFSGQPLKRNVTFVFHGYDTSSYKIEADGCIIQKVFYDDVICTLSISAEINAISSALIKIS